MTPGEVRSEFRDRIGGYGLQSSQYPVLVACSGGGDSVALLHLTVEFLGADLVHCATIDHGLRPEAAEEVALVRRHCQALGVTHHLRMWHWDGHGNLQAAARTARRQILTEVADEIGADRILLGHTADDQAETVILRLARGSGIDGLAGMARDSGRFLRPLLSVPRDTLRDWLRAEDIDWAEDPSNEDTRFDRVKVRQLMPALAEVGITLDRLTRTAAIMADERDAANARIRAWVADHLRSDGPDLCFDYGAFTAEPRAHRRRLLASVVQWFSGAAYRPRLDDLDRWGLSSWRNARTLGGVIGVKDGEDLRFSREPAAVSPSVPMAPGAIWDNRWIVSGPGEAGLTIGALGDDIRDCPKWRDTGLPRRSLETTPAIRKGNTLVAAPLAGLENGWTATLRPTFTAFLNSH